MLPNLSGHTVNIDQFDTFSIFLLHYPQFTDALGFTSKSVLCMPIHNNERIIIGVTQLINKVNDQPFDENDEHILEASGRLDSITDSIARMISHMPWSYPWSYPSPNNPKIY